MHTIVWNIEDIVCIETKKLYVSNKMSEDTARVTLEHRVLVVFGRHVCQLLTGHEPGVTVSFRPRAGISHDLMNLK